MIKLENISKHYDLGASDVVALDDVNIHIEKGEFVTIMGPSGSGKSTLLHILGILDRPSGGIYRLEGHEIESLPDRELARIRNEHFGFVFQSFNLFPEFNALENVTMPLVYAGVPRRERKEKALKLLNDVGLSNRLTHYPSMLSGGEQQRVAIARALANDPGLILADEPTGNLPQSKGKEILKLLYDLNDQGVTVVMVTHDDLLGTCGKRKLTIQDGLIISDDTVADRYLPE